MFQQNAEENVWQNVIADYITVGRPHELLWPVPQNRVTKCSDEFFQNYTLTTPKLKYLTQF